MSERRAHIDYASPDVAAKRVTNVWATLGCVLAIGFLIPPIALAGAVASWIGLRHSANPHIGGGRAALMGLRLGIVGLALIPVDAVGVWWAVGKIDEIKCRSQLYALTFCVQTYANGNRDQLPSDLTTAVAYGGISTNSPVLFCPASSATTAPSYIYLRPAQHLADIRSPASTVMLYENPNHFGGMHVAFYDGHVEFVSRAKASKVLSELRAGQNPPPSVAAP